MTDPRELARRLEGVEDFLRTVTFCIPGGLVDTVREARRMLLGIVLQGFHCAACESFTSTEKEEHRQCRSCGAGAPRI